MLREHSKVLQQIFKVQNENVKQQKHALSDNEGETKRRDMERGGGGRYRKRGKEREGKIQKGK